MRSPGCLAPRQGLFLCWGLFSCLDFASSAGEYGGSFAKNGISQVDCIHIRLADEQEGHVAISLDEVIIAPCVLNGI